MDRLKLKAAVRTAMMMIVFSATPLIVYSLFTYVPTNVLIGIFVTGMLVFFVGMLYEVNLARVKFEAKVDEAVNRLTK